MQCKLDDFRARGLIFAENTKYLAVSGKQENQLYGLWSKNQLIDSLSLPTNPCNSSKILFQIQPISVQEISV